MSQFDDILAKGGWAKPQDPGSATGTQSQQHPGGEPPSAPPSSGAPQGDPSQSGSEQAPPATTPPANPSLEYETKFLGERLGGRLKNMDEVVERINAYENLQKDHTDLAERSKSLIKPANEFIRKFNQAQEAGIPLESFMQVQKIEKETDPISIVALSQQIKYGLDPEEAKWEALRKYKAASASPDDRDYDADATREAKIALQRDAFEARKHLDEFKSEAMAPVSVTPEMKQQQAQQRIATWAPALPGLINEFEKFSFSEKAANGEEVSVEYPVPRETLDLIKKYVENEVISDFEANPKDSKDVDNLRSVIRAEVIEKCFDQIARHLIKAVADQFVEKQMFDKHNPSGPRKEAPGQMQTSPDRDREIANKFLPSFPVTK